MRFGSKATKRPPGLSMRMTSRRQPPRIRKMMNQAAEQHAIEAFAFERQVFDIAFNQFEAGVFATAERHQFRADIDTDAV